MRVTGERVAVGAKQQVERTQQAAPAAGARRARRFEDGFDATVEKTKKKKTPAKAPVAISRGVVEAGSRALERDRTAPAPSLREAAVLLGGLTAALVVNVLHQLGGEAPAAAPSRSTQRLGELTGALFLEWLATTIEPDTAAALSGVLDEVADFSHRFEQHFGLTPFEATRRFVDFIAATEGDARTRLRGTLYAS